MTLVELVVVLAVISVMAAAAAPSFFGYLEKSKDRECDMNRKNVLLSFESARIMDPRMEMGEFLLKNPACCPQGELYKVIIQEGQDYLLCESHGKDRVKTGDKNVQTWDEKE